MRLISIKRGVSAITLGLCLAACSSTPVQVTSTPAEGYKSLGPAEGKACGSMLLLSTAYYFIPAGANSRVERAYQRALASKPGATGLINVTMQENWAWWLLGTARCVTIKGEAVQ